MLVIQTPQISTPPWQFTPCVNTELHITFLTEWNHLRDVKWKTEWIAWEKNTGSHNLPFINSHKWEIHLKMEILKQPEKKKITNQHFVFLFFFCKVASISCDSIPQKGALYIGKCTPGAHLFFHPHQSATLSECPLLLPNTMMCLKRIRWPFPYSP